MQNTPDVQGSHQILYIESNRERFNKIADALIRTQKTAALNRIKQLVPKMDLNTALQMLQDDFPDLVLTKSPAAAEAGADERPAAGASNPHNKQIAQDRQLAEELAAGVAEAKLDEDTKALFFEGALQKINNAIINKESLDIKSLLRNFDNKETKEAIDRYYTVAYFLTKTAEIQGINKIDFNTILGQLNGTYLEESSKEALNQLHTELNQKRHPENTDMDPKIAQDVDNSSRRRIDNLIAEIAEDVGHDTHESPAAGDRDTRIRQIKKDEEFARRLANEGTVVPSNPAARVVDTRDDELIAQLLANQGTVVPSNPAASTVITQNDELIAQLLANQGTVVPSNPAAGAAYTREDTIDLAFDIIHNDNEIVATMESKKKMAIGLVDKYEQELKAMINLDNFKIDIFLNGYKTQQEKDLVRIIYNRLQQNQ